MAKKRESNPLPPLPPDPSDAMRHVYTRVQRLEALRAQCADQIRAELRAAKEETDISPASIREAARLSRMTPERREKWESKLNGALVLLGYSQIVLEDNPPAAGGNAAVRRKAEVERLEAERRGHAEEIRGYYRAADAAGLDVASLRSFVRMGLRQYDPLEMAEWFDGVDTTGKLLGVWDKSLEMANA